MPFTHDWGICSDFKMDLFDMRRADARPHGLTKEVIAWSNMGDLNSLCYRPDQDIVTPARTCVQDELRARFPSTDDFRPIRERRYLAWFRGRILGQGSTLRARIACPRRYSSSSPSWKYPVKLQGAEDLPSLWNELPPGMDYLDMLNDTIFCPIPAGTTGWAARTIDVIYAGCIPVLFATHHQPFWSLFDWTRFSVLIQPEEVERMEEILIRRYTWSVLEEIQRNLARVRQAFLHPSDDRMEEHLTTEGPLFFALHATEMIRRTKYPQRRGWQ